ncbi:helix-turn-helix transcriptional regulator [Rahnella ecdela]|uniref:HTH luxR-type domain-containing protein n=1 Tax=Rahnella ecdela TaxID=2816250 RepID=A0ABS6LAD7_9GAMM|nr:LuxR C-terminal-related transcriptional regulator [Rahnella ecdela]MBU9843815.1 hypothetical protein [Rahnella ecdela]
MDNISIVSDNVYTKIAFIKITEQILTKRMNSQKISIFSFEKNWLNEHELSAIIECKSERILIIALTPLLSFLSTLLLPRRVIYECYDASVSQLNNTLSQLILASPMIETNPELSPSEFSTLTPNEKKIIRLYINGLSLSRIAQMTNKSIKTISSHKRKAMKKMGIETNIQLIQTSMGILLANNLDIINRHRIETLTTLTYNNFRYPN